MPTSSRRSARRRSALRRSASQVPPTAWPRRSHRPTMSRAPVGRCPTDQRASPLRERGAWRHRGRVVRAATSRGVASRSRPLGSCWEYQAISAPTPLTLAVGLSTVAPRVRRSGWRALRYAPPACISKCRVARLPSRCSSEVTTPFSPPAPLLSRQIGQCQIVRLYLLIGLNEAVECADDEPLLLPSLGVGASRCPEWGGIQIFRGPNGAELLFHAPEQQDLSLRSLGYFKERTPKRLTLEPR